jgi:hypothetical protein
VVAVYLCCGWSIGLCARRCCDITELLVPISYFMLEGRKDSRRLGMLYLCTFTLLKLSGERNFGVALNKPYQVCVCAPVSE